MRASFKSDSLQDVPMLVIEADSELEWRALQLYLKLKSFKACLFSICYEPKDDENAEALSDDPQNQPVGENNLVSEALSYLENGGERERQYAKALYAELRRKDDEFIVRLSETLKRFGLPG